MVMVVKAGKGLETVAGINGKLWKVCVHIR